MPLLDAAKGVACLFIVGHHLCRYGPLPEAAALLAPRLIGWLAEHGRLAVQVFLVIAGFLAAGSLAPEGVMRASAGNWQRVWQRYARLAMPYLAALSVTVLLAAAIRPWFDNEVVPAAPVFSQLLAHGLLLQDVLGYEALSTGVWYVAIDFQLFVLALAVVSLAEWLQRRWQLEAVRAAWLLALLVLMLACASLFAFNLKSGLDATAFYFVGSYGLGMLAFWVGRIRNPWRWGAALALLAAIGAEALAWEWRIRIAIALVSALLLALSLRRGWLADPPAWLVTRPVMWLGRISYSLFLIHFPVILLVNALVSRAGPHSPWIDLLAMGAALALAMGAATLLHRWVESRPATGRLTFSLLAVLLASGALVAA
ncbi:Peptidoglycan/LPS O-acetylase OafA/YrhL, contains acyltransferase and SGNH-hydrolase domains [Variovorax sp. OV329]|nr:Peptidoglycan/LPS O-acetylase OafA/YrhL, contains acyltransferase and SGNH-hydrolase domains [Variovorax sp. OV329]